MGTTLKVNSFRFSDRAVFPNYNWDLSGFTGTQSKIKTSVTTGFSQELHMANLACGYCSTKNPDRCWSGKMDFCKVLLPPRPLYLPFQQPPPLGSSLSASGSWDHCCLVCIHRLGSTHSFNPLSSQALQKQKWTLYKPNCILEEYFGTWRPQASSVTLLLCIMQAVEAPGLTYIVFLAPSYSCNSTALLIGNYSCFSTWRTELFKTESKPYSFLVIALRNVKLKWKKWNNGIFQLYRTIFWHTLPGKGRSNLSLCAWLGVPEMLEQVFWFRLTSASTEWFSYAFNCYV